MQEGTGRKRWACAAAAMLLLPAVLWALSCGGPGAREEKFQMRASTPLSQHGTVGKGLKRLCDLVEEKSGGRITTRVFYTGQLGNQREQVEMVHDGSLEVVTTLASGTGRYVPQLAIFEFPYIYKDEAHLVRVLDTLEGEVSRLLAPHNFVAFGGQNMGFRHMLNKKRPIRTLADMQGLKMRGPNPVYVEMFKAFGSSGTTTDWSEIYNAIQTGVIDGMEASPDMIYSMKFHEQAKYLSKTYHIAACLYYMIRKDWFDSLPPDLQSIVVEASREAAAYQNQLDLEDQSKSMEQLVQEGVIVNEVEDLEAFKAVQAQFKERYIREKGPAWADLYDKILAVE